MTATLTDPRLTAPSGGLRERLAGLERRTTAFLDQALGLKETS